MLPPSPLLAGSHATTTSAAVASVLLLCVILTLPLFLLLRLEPSSNTNNNNNHDHDDTPVIMTKRHSSKRLKMQRQRDVRRERQQTPKHGAPKTKREKLALAMAKFWQQQELVGTTAGLSPLLNFDTMHDRTMAHFTTTTTACTDGNRKKEDDVPWKREPDVKTADAWYWNVQDEYVVRYSYRWSNTGRRVGRQSSCCWVLDPEYYDKHQTKENDPHNTDTTENNQNVNNNNNKKPTWLMGQCRYEDMEFYATYHIDFDNFFQHTRAHYVKAEDPPRTLPHFTSPSGSQYWQGPDGVYRCSDHWSNTCGRIATCWWTYAPDRETRTAQQPRLTGYCAYQDFTLRVSGGGSNSRPFVPGLRRFMAKNPKARKIFRYRNARNPGRMDIRRTMVNDRALPQIMFQPKTNRQQTTVRFNNRQSGEGTNGDLLSACLCIYGNWKGSFESWLWENAIWERLTMLWHTIVPFQSTSTATDDIASSGTETPMAPP